MGKEFGSVQTRLVGNRNGPQLEWMVLFQFSYSPWIRPC